MNTKIKVVLFAAMFIGSGCSYANKTTEGSSKMLDLKNNKDWCAGRYTFKLPSNAKLSNGSDIFNSFKIESVVGANKSDFDSAFTRLKKEYTTSVSTIIFEGPEKQIDSKATRLFAAKAGTIKKAPLHLYGLVLDRNVLFKIEIPYMPEKKDIVYAEMNRLLVGIKARNNNTIPNDKGVCITNGFISDSGSEFRKSTNTLAFTVNGYPSIILSFQVDATTRQLPDLITRMDQNLKSKGAYHLTNTSFKTIRKGIKNQTSGNQLSGLEWVSKSPMKGQDGTLITWEHAGTAIKSLDPAIQLHIDTGFDGNNVQTASISENETLKVYESILNTIIKF